MIAIFPVLAGLLQPPPSLEQRLERAAICFRVQRLACVEAELSQIEAGLPRLAPALRLRALVMNAELALTRQTDAAPALARVLATDADWTPDGAWPAQWRTALETARALRKRQLDRSGPRIEVDSITAVANRPLHVTAQTYDPAGVARVSLRWGPALDARMPMQPLDQNRTVWTARLAPTVIRPPAQRIAIEAIDGIGNASLWGPQRLLIDAVPEATAFYETWWFWTATGVVLAGVATAALWPDEPDTITRVDVAGAR